MMIKTHQYIMRSHPMQDCLQFKQILNSFIKVRFMAYGTYAIAIKPIQLMSVNVCNIVCVYNKQKYLTGEEVKTEQPCLRCTCKKGVLLCSLRVCPPVTARNLTVDRGSQCQVIREQNTCCPTIYCQTSAQYGNYYCTIFMIFIHSVIIII